MVGRNGLAAAAAERPTLAACVLGDSGQSGDRRGLNEWAELVGASSRTLARLFQQELGMSYLYWRQQVCAMSALPRLGAGEPVTLIASDLGYDTPGAFSSMFRRIMNAAPASTSPDPIRGSKPRRQKRGFEPPLLPRTRAPTRLCRSAA